MASVSLSLCVCVSVCVCVCLHSKTGFSYQHQTWYMHTFYGSRSTRIDPGPRGQKVKSQGHTANEVCCCGRVMVVPNVYVRYFCSGLQSTERISRSRGD